MADEREKFFNYLVEQQQRVGFRLRDSMSISRADWTSFVRVNCREHNFLQIVQFVNAPQAKSSSLFLRESDWLADEIESHEIKFHWLAFTSKAARSDKSRKPERATDKPINQRVRASNAIINQ